MKPPYMQFNRQKVATLLLAGLILAAGLTWVRVAAQPIPVEQPWAYLRVVKGSKLGVSTEGVSFRGCESELLPWSQLKAVKGGKGGISGGDVHK